MKKLIAILLIGMFLPVSATAGLEYEKPSTAEKVIMAPLMIFPLAVDLVLIPLKYPLHAISSVFNGHDYKSIEPFAWDWLFGKGQPK